MVERNLYAARAHRDTPPLHVACPAGHARCDHRVRLTTGVIPVEAVAGQEICLAAGCVEHWPTLLCGLVTPPRSP